MNSLHRMLALAVLVQALSPAAHAAAPGRGDAAQAFAGAPASDEVLATVVGGQRPSFTANLRSMGEAETLIVLQQVGQTSRIALDNWWAQTGAALIANNLIAPGPL